MAESRFRSDIRKPLDKLINVDPNVLDKSVTVTEEMEDKNSWNGLIFGFIKAREKWLLNLIWRKRLEHKDDNAEKKVEDSKDEKDKNLSKEDPLFIRWCEERRDRFNAINAPAQKEGLENDAPVQEEGLENDVQEEGLENDAPVQGEGLENEIPTGTRKLVDIVHVGRRRGIRALSS